MSIACKHTAGNLKTVTYYHYNLWVSDLKRLDLRDSLVLNVESIKTDKGCNYVLRSPLEKDSVYLFSYSIVNGSFYYESSLCPTFDSVNFAYKNQNIMLFRSRYDRPESAEEESYIYWNHEYGMVGLDNYSSGPLLLFADPAIPGFAKETLYGHIVNSYILKNKQ